MNVLRLLSATLACAIVLTAQSALAQEPVAFRFAAFGDTPYFAFEEVRLEKIFDDMNVEPLAFVLHVGDIKSGMDRCDDELYLKRKRLFARIRHPFVLIPGDNDWTDCHRKTNGSYDPLERLQFFRETFYAREPALKIERQSAYGRFAEYRENMRWQIGNVLFATFHVVGSNNNRSAKAGEMEWRSRNEAVLSWLQETFENARRREVAGLVLAIHADAHLERSDAALAKGGFADFVPSLRRAVIAFGKPVLFIHGDGHVYHLDHPLLQPDSKEPIENFTRLEVFGAPTAAWVRVSVDPQSPKLFEIEPRR